MKIFMYIWQRKWRIFIISLLTTAIFFTGSCYNAYYTENIMLSFIYPNSEKGKYPDGTRFNIYDILSDEIIKTAIESYNKETDKRIAMSDIEGNISVKENLTADVLSKVEDARNLGLDYSYFTNEYYITFRPMRRINFNNREDLGGLVPYVDNELFVEKFYEAYVDYFMDKHAEKNILSGLTEPISTDEFDYLEITNRYENQVNMCINYLEGKNAENGGFRSSQTGLGFSDLINSFRNLKNVQVKNLTAFVSSSRLTKNSAEFVNKLEVENELNMLEYSKYKAEAEHAQKAMESYDHTFEKNIVVAGVTDNQGLYQTRAKTAYDTITKRAHDAGVKAENLYQDIEENKRLIKEYGSGTVTGAEFERLSKVADGMIKEIELVSSELTTKANITVEEYLKTKSSDYVRREVAGKSYINFGVIIKSAMIFFAAALMVICLSMIKDFGGRVRFRLGIKKRGKKLKFSKKKLKHQK